MLTLDEVRQRLQDRRLAVVAEATGITMPTLWRIRRDPKTGVRYSTLEKLNRYFEQNR